MSSALTNIATADQVTPSRRQDRQKKTARQHTKWFTHAELLGSANTVHPDTTEHAHHIPAGLHAKLTQDRCKS